MIERDSEMSIVILDEEIMIYFVYPRKDKTHEVADRAMGELFSLSDSEARC